MLQHITRKHQKDVNSAILTADKQGDQSQHHEWSTDWSSFRDGVTGASMSAWDTGIGNVTDSTRWGSRRGGLEEAGGQTCLLLRNR